MSLLHRLNKTLFILFIIIGILQSDAFCEIGRDEVGISLGLSTNRDQYWLGEPVIVTARIVNWAQPGIRYDTKIGLDGPNTSVWIYKGNKKGKEYKGHYETRPLSAITTFLRYGKAHEFKLSMVYKKTGANQLAFDHKGNYSILMRQYIDYADESIRIQGPVAVTIQGRSLNFTVIDPPKEGMQAFNLLKANPKAFLDLNRQAASPATRALFQKIVDEFPNTRYAPYCLHALITYNGKLSRTDDRFRLINQKMLKKILADYPQFALRDNMRIELAQNLTNSGQMDAAFEILDAMVAESPDNLYRFREFEMLSGYTGHDISLMLGTSENNWTIFDTLQLPEIMQHNKHVRD